MEVTILIVSTAENTVISPNFHTSKLDEITAFFAVSVIIYVILNDVTCKGYQFLPRKL